MKPLMKADCKRVMHLLSGLQFLDLGLLLCLVVDRNGQICVASYRETRLFFNLVVLKGSTNTPEKLAAVLGKQHVTLLLAKFVHTF